MICKDCYIPMIGVMSSSKEKHERFCRCPKCNLESKRTSIDEYDISFREVLYRTIERN